MNPKLRHRGPRRHRSGAALLILITVVGLAAASLLVGALGRSSGELTRERRTLQALALANEALIGFAVVNGRLPRPAMSAIDGRENPAPCQSELACTGLLPWLTLGLEAGDSWGKLLRYSVTPEFTVAPIQSVQAVATKTVQSRDGDGRLRYLAGHAECTLAAECAPLVVFSNGKNNLGVDLRGMTQANASNANPDEQANHDAAVHFISRPASADASVAGGEFDDLLTWVPLGRLFNQMRAAGSLP